MRLTRSQLYLLLALLTVAVGIVTNVATGQMPDWLQRYSWLSWPLLAVLAFLFIALSVVGGQEPKPKLSKIVLELFKSRVRIVDDALFQHPASDEEVSQYYGGAPVTWDIIAAHGVVERDQQSELLDQLAAPGEQAWMMCIVGEPGAGKTSLAWQLAYELGRQEDALILQILDSEDADVWYHLPDFWEHAQKPFYILVDDVFRDAGVLLALKGLDSNLPVTLLATSRVSEYRERQRLPFPVKRVNLRRPSPKEKKHVLTKLGKTPTQLTAEQRARLEAADQFLVLMMELTAGKELIEIIRDTLNRLRQQDEVVYRAYEYLCYTYQYDMSIPASLLERLDDKGRFYRLLDKRAAKGLIFADESRPSNLQVGHPVIAETSAKMYGRNPRSVIGEVLQAVDTNAWAQRRFVAHLLRQMASCDPEAPLGGILEDGAALIEGLQRDATISEMGIWRALYQNLGWQEKAECCVDMALNREPRDGMDCTVLLGFSQERGLDAALLAQFRRWLRRMPEDPHVRVPYLGLVERYAPEEVAQAINETSAWLGDHPQDNFVRTRYLGLVERKGTDEQVAQILAETSTWLGDHPQDNYVRTRYLGLVECRGTDEQVAQTLAETSAWLGEHPQDSSVRTRYLGLVECKGTDEQVAQTLAETSAWLVEHPQDSYVRTRYLGLVERKGTDEQVAQTLAETSAWLARHPEDIEVRKAYLGLVKRKGTLEQKALAIRNTKPCLPHCSEDSTIPALYQSLISRLAGDKRGIQLLDREYLEDAQKRYESTLAKKLRSQGALYGYGCLLLGLGEYAEAAKQFRTLLKLNKGHTAARRGLALALSSLGEFRRAENEFKHALWWAENVTDYPPSILYHDLGLFYLEQERYADARSAFEKAIEEYPKGFANYWHLGEVLMAQDDYRNATDALQAALDKAPKHLAPSVSEEIVALLRECKEQLGT